MIAACPNCGARYRIEKGQLRPEGVRLRCARCEAVFRVRSPSIPAATEPAPQPVSPRTGEDAMEGAVAPPETTEPRAQRESLVLVADPDVEGGKQISHALASWGLQPLLVHDGVEAMLAIQRTLPRAVVLDAALPKMFGFEICEVMKRNESLRGIRVVLLGAIHHRARYRRPPSELYGADAYVERPQLPEALWPILRGFGLSLREPGTSVPGPEPAPPAAEDAPREEEPARSVAPASAPPPEEAGMEAAPQAPPAREDETPGDEAPSPEVARAERLARIIVSDITLYNAEKLQAAVRAGNVVEAMRVELDEGRALFQQRVDADVRGQRDFLAEELLRVARGKGMV